MLEFRSEPPPGDVTGPTNPGGAGDPGDTTGAAIVAELRQALTDADAPAELLRLLDGPGTPEELLQRVLDSGMVPAPADGLAGLLEFWQPLLALDTDPLQAEVAGIEFVDTMRRSGIAADDLPEALAALVDQAEEYGGAAALAMLRVLAVMALPPVRERAAAAADRLVAAGLADPAWVTGLGSPVPGRCFGYADVMGAQEAIAIGFRYGSQEHAICVLIDHDRGGGVKDCWPTDQVNEIRMGYESMAAPGVFEYREYAPAEAYAILSAALGKDPCPEQPDQIDDVRDHLELLRSRVALLAGGAG